MSKKAQELYDSAEKKLKKWFSFGGNKYEEAAELFEKAGNQFKLAKEWKSAGAAFMRCSDCHQYCKNTYECTEALVEAGRSYKKVRDEDAVLCFTTAINMHCDEGKFSTAAKLQKELGEYYKDAEMYDKAAECYKSSADYYSGEEQHTSANTSLLEVGKIYCEKLEMPLEAVQLFEQVAKSYLQHGTMKYQVKDLYLRCMMCRFRTIKATNISEQVAHCREAYQRYEDKDLNLSGTREAELIEGVLKAAEEQDEKMISQCAHRYESIKKLDDFQCDCLLSLKRVLEEDLDDDAALCM
eukprot:TRINITY_DN587_c3_g1_i1.p1 TRINITY_DN587_c3_g1~~TRINITY_DN587_c3_g1_i1.p1  ORF type:complete len:309 (+),score=87.42 TRINITY_DN587_c3_g1_i1:38-928(+)